MARGSGARCQAMSPAAKYSPRWGGIGCSNEPGGTSGDRAGRSDSERAGQGRVARCQQRPAQRDHGGIRSLRSDGCQEGPREIAGVACDQPEQAHQVDLDRLLTVGGPQGCSVRDLHPRISEEDRLSRLPGSSPRLDANGGAASSPRRERFYMRWTAQEVNQIVLFIDPCGESHLRVLGQSPSILNPKQTQN